MQAIIPQQVNEKIQQGAQLIDIRSFEEFQCEHIPGSDLQSLTIIKEQGLKSRSSTLIFYCKSGMRTQINANLLKSAAQAIGVNNVYLLAGGITAWQKSGLPIEKGKCKNTPDIIRQMQIAAGSLVLLSILLGYFVHPTFYWLSAFIGAGLIFAGITGFCGLAKLLAKMPWNQRS
ncbi:rhodanese family protein [Suttonella ornithocola]|uniref:Inner membrane protein ygaP n=1 Tax=Suttonella ornithocola TaxID=279832 RepID=A0A380MZR6_9GAMM|nr:rhodanese family protein [Suttonella ornithocola]SUO96977.1 Inner membrane protein ygaP [Suttonella ornithocola]